MNINHANTISMVEILSKLGIHSQRLNKSKAWYLSPLREEKTPSFQVDLQNNRWYDYGEGIGGDVVDFVCAYLKSHKQEHTKSDALRWIKNMTDNNADLLNLLLTPHNYKYMKEDSALVLRNTKPIQHLGLINYLKKRGIPIEVARQHLKELHVYNKDTGKKFFALGFPNEEGGFELRNPFFKGCLRPKAISFIRGITPKSKGIHIFEGFMDYLSIVTQLSSKQLIDDAIILNSLSCLKQITPYIQKYGYEHAYLWIDNDKAGEKALIALREFFQTEGSIMKCGVMNKIYAPHKDVNAWHMSQLNLSL